MQRNSLATGISQAVTNNIYKEISMNRDRLIAEVKNEYTRLASAETVQQLHQSTAEMTPDAYYEKLLNRTLAEIELGTFDDFNSGIDVVNAVANDKSWLSQWT